MAQVSVRRSAGSERVTAPFVPERRGGRPSPRAVGAFVPQLTRKAFEKHGFSTAALITEWATIVGREVAACTVPERLKWPRDVAVYDDVEEGARGRPGATLVLAVDPARALDIEYRAGQLIERINAFFGYRAIASLRIVQAPAVAAMKPARPAFATAVKKAAPAASQLDLSAVRDEGLRLALAKLGAAMLTRDSRA